MSMLRRVGASTRVANLGSQRTANPWVIPSNSSNGFSSSGIAVTDDSAMQLLAVYACVRLLAGCLSGLPLGCLKLNGTVRTQMNPAPNIIADPFGGAGTLSGRGLTRKMGLSQMMVSMLLRGNAYGWIVSVDELGNPESIQVLNPDVVDVKVDRDTGELQYIINRKPVPTNRVVHLQGLTQPGYPKGLSVIDAAQRSIGLGIAAEEYGARFFGSGAHLSGVIETEADLDPDKAQQLADDFTSAHAGLTKAHKVGVLSGGAKWAPISVAPEDAQFLGTRESSKSDIAMLFGVPPHMIGAVDRTTSWGKGIEEQTMGFLKFTLADWAQRFEDAFSAMVPAPWVARFDYDELLRPDATVRWASHQIARNIAAKTPNEVRADEGMPPLPGDLGDDPFASLNSAHTNDPGWTPDGDLGTPAVPADGPPAPPAVVPIKKPTPKIALAKKTS